jgi:hypothetical protein
VDGAIRRRDRQACAKASIVRPCSKGRKRVSESDHCFTFITNPSTMPHACSVAINVAAGTMSRSLNTTLLCISLDRVIFGFRLQRANVQTRSSISPFEHGSVQCIL